MLFRKIAFFNLKIHCKKIQKFQTLFIKINEKVKFFQVKESFKKLKIHRINENTQIMDSHFLNTLETSEINDYSIGHPEF